MEVRGFLENSLRKKTLIDFLLHFKYSLPQQDLFSGVDSESRLDSILEDILLSFNEGKPLYRTWVQNVDGKNRLLNLPNKSFRKLMDHYFIPLIKKVKTHSSCHGGEEGWSVKRSLETHLPCDSVLSFDLKGAFENVSVDHVYKFFYSLLNNYFSYKERNDLASFFSMVLTVNYSGNRGLPQGSPCSMVLFNRILYPLDEILSDRARRRELKYARWVDDITISSTSRKDVSSFIGAVELAAEKFPISQQKIYFQDGNDIYLLGHKINEGRVFKNTEEEKLRNKCPPLDFNKWFGIINGDYDSWKN